MCKNIILHTVLYHIADMITIQNMIYLTSFREKADDISVEMPYLQTQIQKRRNRKKAKIALFYKMKP